MEKYGFAGKIARPAVASPDLTRPDWSAISPRNPGLMWLDKNENIDPELTAITSKILAQLPVAALYSYPDSGPFYHKLGNYLGVGADHLLLAAGSDGVIRSVFEAFINQGDVVVHTQPTFAMYMVYCRMYGAQAVVMEYEPSDLGPFLPVDRVVETIARSKPKLVCLPNPDSPTGTVFSPLEMRSIIEAAGEAGAIILIDEAYHPFYSNSVLPWVDENPHLVVARTFSKAWGLAGLRIGYAVASPQIANLLHKVRPMYEVNTLGIYFVERMLDYSEEMLASVKRVNAGKNDFLTAMADLGFKTFRAEGNFLHVAFGNEAPVIHEALKKVVLYRLDFKDPCLKGYSRFSAAPMGLFRPVIQAIHQAVGKP